MDNERQGERGGDNNDEVSRFVLERELQWA